MSLTWPGRFRCRWFIIFLCNNCLCFFLAETLVKTVPFSKGWTCGDVLSCFLPRLEIALWGSRLFETISTGTWKHTRKTPKQKHIAFGTNIWNNKNSGVSMEFTLSILSFRWFIDKSVAQLRGLQSSGIKGSNATSDRRVVMVRKVHQMMRRLPCS